MILPPRCARSFASRLRARPERRRSDWSRARAANLAVSRSTMGLRNWMPALLTRISIATPCGVEAGRRRRRPPLRRRRRTRLEDTVCPASRMSAAAAASLAACTSVEHDRRARLRKAARHGAAEAARRSGDQRRLAGQVEQFRRHQTSPPADDEVGRARTPPAADRARGPDLPSDRRSRRESSASPSPAPCTSRCKKRGPIPGSACWAG